MPANYDTLNSLFVGDQRNTFPDKLKLFFQTLGSLFSSTSFSAFRARLKSCFHTLTTLFAFKGHLFLKEPGLDNTLQELEDRGLIGWDKRANRYDLHPIVRGVVWNGLNEKTRNGVFSSLEVHFQAVPKIEDYRKVNSLEDLTPAIELYNTLIGLGRYEEACDLFYERLETATLTASAPAVSALNCWKCFFRMVWISCLT